MVLTEEKARKKVQKYIKKHGKPFVTAIFPMAIGGNTMYMGPPPETGNMFRNTWDVDDDFSFVDIWNAIQKYEEQSKKQHKELLKLPSYRKLVKQSRKLKKLMKKELGGK